eukprot:scaffold23810_cov131-Isochrysis_galbana.AAC.6
MGRHGASAVAESEHALRSRSSGSDRPSAGVDDGCALETWAPARASPPAPWPCDTNSTKRLRTIGNGSASAASSARDKFHRSRKAWSNPSTPAGSTRSRTAPARWIRPLQLSTSR